MEIRESYSADMPKAVITGEARATATAIAKSSEIATHNAILAAWPAEMSSELLELSDTSVVPSTFQ